MKTQLEPEKLYWALFNNFEMRLSGECVNACHHQGDCEADCKAWVDRVRAQIESDNFPNKPTPDKIRDELSEYGAWDDEELKNDEENFIRLIWCAAGNIAEESEPDCSEPVK